MNLIQATTDSHLWADTYDRKLIDIFGVESEIAKTIAESLQAKLTGREEQTLAVKPTNNPEAYDAYLRGLAFEARNSTPPTTDREGSMSSQHLYEVRPRKDHQGVDLISDALPFGRLWHGEPNAVSNAKAKRKAGALTPPPPAMGAWKN